MNSWFGICGVVPVGFATDKIWPATIDVSDKDVLAFDFRGSNTGNVYDIYLFSADWLNGARYIYTDNSLEWQRISLDLVHPAGMLGGTVEDLLPQLYMMTLYFTGAPMGSRINIDRMIFDVCIGTLRLVKIQRRGLI